FNEKLMKVSFKGSIPSITTENKASRLIINRLSSGFCLVYILLKMPHLNPISCGWNRVNIKPKTIQYGTAVS
ncbi:hypothetical protein, partial [Dyadobacter arcticus]